MSASIDLRPFGALAQMARDLREAAERTEDVANRAGQLEAVWAQYEALREDETTDPTRQGAPTDRETRNAMLESMAATLREIQERVRATESDVSQLSLLDDVQQTRESGKLKQAGQLMLGVQADTAGEWKSRITRAWQGAMGL